MLRYHPPPAWSELLNDLLDAWHAGRSILSILDTGETSMGCVAWRGVRIDPVTSTLIISGLTPLVPLGQGLRHSQTNNQETC